MTRRTKRRLVKVATAAAVLACAAACAWFTFHPPQHAEENTWTDPLNSTQRSLVDAYSSEAREAADLIAGSKWQAGSGQAVLTFSNDTAVLLVGGKENSRCTWAISSYDSGSATTTAKKTTATLSVLDGDGQTFTMSLSRSYKDGELTDAELSSSRFYSGETFKRVSAADTASVEVEVAPDAAYELSGIGKDAAASKVKDWAERNAPAAKKAVFAGEAAVTSKAAKLVWKLDDAKATKVTVTLDKETGELSAS